MFRLSLTQLQQPANVIAFREVARRVNNTYTTPNKFPQRDIPHDMQMKCVAKHRTAYHKVALLYIPTDYEHDSQNRKQYIVLVATLRRVLNIALV